MRCSSMPAVLLAGLALVALGPAAPTRADVVVLRNGRVLEGVIEEENADRIVLRMVGTRLTLSGDRVARVERSSDAERETMIEEFARAELPPPPFPEALKPLRAEMDRLGRLRGAALQSASALKQAVGQGPVLERQHKAAVEQYRQLHAQLSELHPSRRSRSYNEKVQEVNRAATEANRLQEQLEALRTQEPAMRQQMADYTTLLSRLGAEVKQALEALPEGASFEREWLGSVAAQLAAWEGDFAVLQVPMEHDGRSTRVTARINDRLEGLFLLDTGASVVTLTETLAQRLHLAYDRSAPIQLTLADGSTAPGYPVMLPSVAVGDARVENVRAVVMSKPPGPGLDGLLGMSFLGEFSMRHDGASNTLELKRLRR